jgi:hypothetical protein
VEVLPADCDRRYQKSRGFLTAVAWVALSVLKHGRLPQAELIYQNIQTLVKAFLQGFARFPAAVRTDNYMLWFTPGSSHNYEL